MPRFSSLFPIDVQGDGHEIVEKLSTLQGWLARDKNFDIHVTHVSTGILVALKLYEEKGLEAALDKLDRLINLVGGPRT